MACSLSFELSYTFGFYLGDWFCMIFLNRILLFAPAPWCAFGGQTRKFSIGEKCCGGFIVGNWTS